MPYHFPIKAGDRVALAPHHDLWMAGCRFGTVTSVGGEGMVSGRFYFVDLDTGRNVTLLESDLLGAVRHPSGQTPDSLCERLRFMDRKYGTVPESPLHHDNRCKDH